MARKKLKKILESDALPNIFSGQREDSNKRLADYLPAGRSLTLEVGCGCGDYSIKMADFFPQKNFIGVDIKGSRLWNAAKSAEALHLGNVAFLRTSAEFLCDFFQENSVSEIWITFPDPFHKKRDHKWRIMSEKFLRVYEKILARDGIVHLKTDHIGFFEYARNEINKLELKTHIVSYDVYGDSLIGLVSQIQTRYEIKHLQNSRKIKYLSFQF